MEKLRFCMLAFSLLEFYVIAREEYMSALGDPGMRRDSLRVAIEAWNQCNEVGEEVFGFGSPRMADCFDVDNSASQVKLLHMVDERDNKLGVSNGSFGGINASNVDVYAANKEIYLGDKCQVQDNPRPWQFWMTMVKSGNMDTLAATCPENGKKSMPFPPESGFPCFGLGCMNMPVIYHNYTDLQADTDSKLKGSFYGTWDLDADQISKAAMSNRTSYFNITWEKEIGRGSWVFHHFLKTSSNYPWLMLYLRSDATEGYSGGYHYETRGMSKIVPKSPDFKVKFRLEVKQGGGPNSQFYLMDIGGCWKNNGKFCDGNVITDVTRYSEMIINPETKSWCTPESLKLCPPYHCLSNGTKIHRTDKENYPYDAYHLWCAPGNAEHVEEPYTPCDPYSNILNFMHNINILQVPKSPDFKVKFRLEVKQGGGPNSQFYLMDIGGCWKNNGKLCDGNVITDVTRYSEMIINPETKSWCTPESLKLCPPYHCLSNGTKIHRTDMENYPYDAYHLWCAPGNAEHVEEPYTQCDPYSNPQAQEILQILPHPVWGEYGYPTKKGDGWIGDPRTWELDVGRLSQALYFYQDPGTNPVERHWPSIDLGTEIYISSDQVAEWIVSDFDIVVPKLRMILE